MQQRRRELTSVWGPIALFVIGFALIRLLFNPPTRDTAAQDLLAASEIDFNQAKMKTLVRLSPAVAQALKSGRPVVALESTVVTHGG